MNEHGVRRSSGLETDCEEDDLLIGISARDLQAIEWRVNNANVRTLRLQREQSPCEPGTRSMSPNEQKITSGREMRWRAPCQSSQAA